ncbi:MAG: hypothetical protein O7C56_00205 [Rickettsia endosymbiont of Ixodes persulcatus]|nr:hypothetical protein [Rickettsia endosymbiont of Ixodes persulcatus]
MASSYSYDSRMKLFKALDDVLSIAKDKNIGNIERISDNLMIAHQAA